MLCMVVLVGAQRDRALRFPPVPLLPTWAWDPLQGAGMGAQPTAKCQGCPSGLEPDHRHLSDHRDHQTSAQAPLSLLPLLSWQEPGCAQSPAPHSTLGQPPWASPPQNPTEHHSRSTARQSPVTQQHSQSPAEEIELPAPGRIKEAFSHFFRSLFPCQGQTRR